MSEAADLVQSAYEAFGRGDVPAVLEALSERVEWDVSTVLPQGASVRGRDGVGEFFQNLGSIWADLTLDIEQTVDGGDTVVAIGRAAGRLRNANDAAAGYTFVHMFTVEGGQVTRFREWGDPDEELREHSA
jgi:ketosteroid isomerase-like protein